LACFSVKHSAVMINRRSTGLLTLSSTLPMGQL
jgi:hypothetical protein